MFESHYYNWSVPTLHYANNRSSLNEKQKTHIGVLHIDLLPSCLHSESDKPLWSPENSGKPAADLPLICRTGPVRTIKHLRL